MTSGKNSEGSGRRHNNSIRDVRPETDGREETGGTGQYVRRPGESF